MAGSVRQRPGAPCPTLPEWGAGPGASTVFGLLMMLIGIGIGMVERDGIVIALGNPATVAAAQMNLL
jgi:hypothetical protein